MTASFPQRPAIVKVAAVALVLIVTGASPAPTRAEGPNNATFDAEINGGAPIPAPGSPVTTRLVLTLGAGTTDPPPTDTALPDTMRATLGGITFRAGPGSPGGGTTCDPATIGGCSDIGAQIGSLDFNIQTNAIPALGGNNIATSSTYAGLIPKCGDNRGGIGTRDYALPNGVGFEDQQLALTDTLGIFAGDMRAAFSANNRVDAMFGDDPAPWNPAEYADESALGGTRFIQSFDDDNNNGYPDHSPWEPAGPLTKVEPTSAGGVADPYATGPGGTYLTGVPQTQHDYDHDGLPNGVEYMPEFLPDVVDSLHLEPYWVARGFGILDVFHGIVPPIDVHTLMFTGGPFGGQTVELVLLGNPLVPPDPAYQNWSLCAPFAMTTNTNATTTAPDFGKGMVSGVTFGDVVQQVATGASSAVSMFVSDEEDFDQDGRVGPSELCPFDATTNADPDNDLVAASCDPDGPATKTVPDHDGDGFLNSEDNCPVWANPLQEDDDGDGVGDVPFFCDTLLTTDNLTGLVAGAGPGLPSTTSYAMDRDLLCADAYLGGGTEALGDPDVMCFEAADANDDGEGDAADGDSDQDGDGVADDADPNPLFPFDSSHAGMDFDNDGCTNGQEDGPNPNTGGMKLKYSWWDNYDVTGDGSVDLSDTLDILGYFGASASYADAHERDRAIPDPLKPQILLESNDGVDLTDALNNLAQFGMSCGGEPGFAPIRAKVVATPPRKVACSVVNNLSVTCVFPAPGFNARRLQLEFTWEVTAVVLNQPAWSCETVFRWADIFKIFTRFRRCTADQKADLAGSLDAVAVNGFEGTVLGLKYSWHAK